MARDLSAARTNFGRLPEELSGANEPRSIAADACCGPSSPRRVVDRTGWKLRRGKRTHRDGVTKISRYGYPAGFGPLARRAFSASGMEKPGRGNNADAPRHRRGSPIEGAATLSLDAFSRRALPQTWLAGRRTERLLRQGSSRDADRSQSAMAIFARWLTPFGARPSQLLHVVVADDVVDFHFMRVNQTASSLTSVIVPPRPRFVPRPE